MESLQVLIVPDDRECERRLQDAFAHWKLRKRIPRSEGLLLWTTWWLFCGPASILNYCLFRQIMPMYMQAARRCAIYGMFHATDANCVFRFASDFYKVTTTSILLVCYAVCYECLFENGVASYLLVAVCIAIELMRVAEIVAVATVLLCDSNYQPKPGARAVINTLWNYAEVTIAFGGLHLAAAKTFSDYAVAKNKLAESFFTALYFSMMTISTVGFGDVTPSTSSSLWQALTMVEVGIGLYLVLIILQRVVSK